MRGGVDVNEKIANEKHKKKQKQQKRKILSNTKLSLSV